MKNLLVCTIAFAGGAVLLGLEITASRILAPYFGNSIYVWGSLISVFLLALSIGYFFGGAVADRRPSFLVLSLVMCASGVMVLALPFITLPVSRFIVELNLEFRLSVLLASLLFFLPPSVLMGMASPFIIRLSASDISFIGRTAGNIYAVSTLGSIVGALGVSFFLIPVMGSRAIVFLSGGVLILVALLCLPAHRMTTRAPRAGHPAWKDLSSETDASPETLRPPGTVGPLRPLGVKAERITGRRGPEERGPLAPESPTPR